MSERWKLPFRRVARVQKPGRRAGPVWHHSAVGAQRERKREAANKRKGCHRERESPSNRRSLPTCAGQPFRSAHLLHEQL